MKILFIEDEENITKYAELFLRKKGHEVISVSDADMIGEVLSGFDPDLVIVDLHLNEEFRGVGALQELKDRGIRAKIIVHSHESRKRVEDRLRNFSIEDYLEKPIEINDLAAKIEEISKRM
jgi:DNA-binding response OmpR family regulator